MAADVDLFVYQVVSSFEHGWHAYWVGNPQKEPWAPLMCYVKKRFYSNLIKKIPNQSTPLKPCPSLFDTHTLIRIRESSFPSIMLCQKRI